MVRRGMAMQGAAGQGFIGNLFGISCLGLALFVMHMPETGKEKIILQPDSYQQAEHFGCQEVSRVCRARHRSTEVSQWTKNSKHGRIKRS